MSKLLTREQNEELIKNLECYCSPNAQEWEKIFTFGELKEIIAKLTESPFPEYRSNAPIQIGHTNTNGSSCIEVMINDDGFINWAKYLDADEFKEFTRACNAVVKWLERHE